MKYVAKQSLQNIPLKRRLTLDGLRGIIYPRGQSPLLTTSGPTTFPSDYEQSRSLWQATDRNDDDNRTFQTEFIKPDSLAQTFSPVDLVLFTSFQRTNSSPKLFFTAFRIAHSFPQSKPATTANCFP
jgi:hypothetical protein